MRRRFVTLVVLFLFTIPFGISISGCSKGGTAAVFCGSGDTGPVVGQVSTIALTPRIYGISLNQGQIGQVAAPQATDCKGSTVTVSSYTYGVFDATGHQSNDLLQIADVVPSGVNAGKLCAGNWNRNTGGGIPDYTTCNPTGKSGEVYIVASGAGATSNTLPIFVHPKVTSVVLGNPTTACAATDSAVEAANQSSNCCSLSKQATVTAAPYDGASCISQSQSRQLVGRAFDANGNNITCKVGHLNFAAQATTIASIDENGVATAQQPGSTVISADLTQAGSSAGFFSTCPPTAIKLSVPSSSGTVTNVVVNQNTPQPLTAIATDKNNVTLTGLTLNFVSTTPITIPASSTGTITPAFPGAASITAICQPPTCNPSPYNEIGLFGNGKPVASGPVTVTTPGTNSTQLWIASTQSRYILPVDFTNPALGASVRLPFAPNSMVMSNDGSSIYMGTPTELMIFNATTNSMSREDATVAGQVLAVSPDGASLVISDPRKQLIYLYSTAGTGSGTGASSGTGSGTTTTATSNYGGVATHAQFTPDNQTVYITLGTPDPSDPTNPEKITPTNQLLVHSTFTGWSQITLPNSASDVAITVPSVGAYLAGSPTTGRSYCSSTTFSTATDGTQTVTGNEYYPLADSEAVPTDRVAATNDGKHILGATAANGGTVSDLTFTQALPPPPPEDTTNTVGACPSATVAPDYFSKFRGSLNSYPLGVTANRITGVIPTSNSSLAFVTYTGSGSLPAYTPASGAVTQVPLAGATAPVAGTISSDDLTVYIGTSGDNKVHLVNTRSLTETPASAITPNLPLYINNTDTPSNIVTPNLIVQHPRKATS
jgi:hypothetical protein